VEVKSLQPIHTAPQIATTPASFVPTATRGIRLPEASLKRPVVATRPPHRQEESAAGAQRTVGPAGVLVPAPRLVTAPQQREPAAVLPRPPFGQSKVELPPAGRVQPAPPQKQGRPQGPEKGAENVPTVTRQTSPQPIREPQAARPSPATPPAPAATASPPAARRPEAATPSARSLPGEPANRLAPNRGEKSPPQPQPTREPQAARPSPATPTPAAPAATAPSPASRRPETPQAARPSPAAPAPPAAGVQAPAPPQKQGRPQGPEKGAERKGSPD
jgi:hypothetical protein